MEAIKKGLKTDIVKTPRQKFTSEEDKRLCELVTVYGNKAWKKIAQIMQTKNTRQCRERYINYLAPNLTNGPWTQEEDYSLIQFASQMGPHWSKIAKMFPTRSDVNVKNRYALLVSKGKAPLLSSKEIKVNKDFQSETNKAKTNFIDEFMSSPLEDDIIFPTDDSANLMNIDGWDSSMDDIEYYSKYPNSILKPMLNCFIFINLNTLHNFFE
ncbi:Myb-like DNA-binding domain containing protein [Trichomonas vaginalis G3]|uniref:Myb-like DNA-binding domain containing protein n=1 Tax=Trichomonas vaginalis (strain ATCC PRA-98 / G3) TaxID=412133 RepID=A2DXQ9_TRIV3|nr:RNA polymerase II transcription regulator recruiting protein [Trichomonas vaginalis G3]EAY14769.1 Myb-like DNA-binding domain containing protein [Trichomonas vaginalis G3]KAI5508042.1 RNA polymerase II transcription regulator recruiting protein [Trichomonas vaginalis G3]|eukprot:XP_001326992.1 Myb-like DNA-binding domain containing protein [Trichomonas vaginalis G3]